MIVTSRQQRQALERENQNWPVEGREIPREQWPSDREPDKTRVIRSREIDGARRLSINRTRLLATGRWDDGLSWDELQAVKRIAGYADHWAVEVYPAEAHVVNAANMRHLWLLPGPPSFAWQRGAADG